MARILLFGAGASGTGSLASLIDGVVDELEIRDPNAPRLGELVAALGDGAEPGVGRRVTGAPDVVVVASPAGTQVALARRAVHQGIPVVTTSNQTSEVRRLLTLDEEARYRSVPVVVGAGFMPSLTCLLARHGAREFDELTRSMSPRPEPARRAPPASVGR